MRQLLRGGVDGLPAAVALGQVGSRHPDVVPHVKVPDGVGPELGVVLGSELAAVVREELVDRQTGVGVVRGDEVGHGATRKTEGPADWKCTARSLDKPPKAIFLLQH